MSAAFHKVVGNVFQVWWANATAAAATGGFVAERLAGRRYRSIATGALRAPCSRRRLSAANAGSVMLRADRGGSIQA